MPKLPVISGKECIAALRKGGFYELRQRGDHVIMHRDNPSATVSIPLHKTLKKGTLRTIIRQAGWTVDEFIDLL
jgi:predicted RNA binding protein YcfA (HicA-like mRNA interferase family)